MTRLTWGAPGERRFETGVDRGVLYFDNTAHAWNGLISVEESPQGGSAQGYYYDGVKYASLIGPEEFQASVTAVTVPEAFDEIDGRKAIAPGFYAGEQPRRAFDFIYRSKIGSDTKGVDAGYKIHIIYNALAEATSKTYTTMSDQTAPMEVSWTLTTMPPKAAGYKPTAHFVIDATKMEQSLVSVLEGILYGGEGVTPRLPQPQELLNMFGSWISIEPGLPIVFLGKKVKSIKLLENMFRNPSFERVPSGADISRTNLMFNPAGRESGSWFSGGGTHQVNRPFPDIDGVNPRVGVEYTLPAVGADRYVTSSGNGYNLVEEGKQYTFSLYFDSDVEFEPTFRIAWVRADGGVIGSIIYHSWTARKQGRMFWTGVAPTGAVRFSGGLQMRAQDLSPEGTKVRITGLLLEKGSQMYPYFDGATSPILGATVAWTGRANNSTSTLVSGGRTVAWQNRATQPTPLGGSYGIGGAGNRTDVIDDRFKSGRASEFTWTTASTSGGYVSTPTSMNVSVDQTWYFAITYTKFAHSSADLEMSFGGGGATWQGLSSGTINNGNGTYTAWAIGKVTAITTGLYNPMVRPPNSGVPVGGKFRVGDIITVESSRPQPFMSGDYSHDADLYPEWSGTVNNSESYLVGITPHRTTSQRGVNVSVLSQKWASNGLYSIRTISIANNSGNTWSSPIPGTHSLTPGKTYTISAVCHIESPLLDDKDAVRLTGGRINILNNVYNIFAQSEASPNAPGSYRLSVTFTPTTQWASFYIRLFNGSTAGKGDLWWDNAMLIETPTPIEYFDASRPYRIIDQMIKPIWSGTSHASTSRAEYITSLPSNPQLGEAWDISRTLYVWDGSVWTPYPMSTVPY